MCAYLCVDTKVERWILSSCDKAFDDRAALTYLTQRTQTHACSVAGEGPGCVRTSFKAPRRSVCDTKSHSWQQIWQQRRRSETGGRGGGQKTTGGGREEEWKRGVAEVSGFSWTEMYLLVGKKKKKRTQFREEQIEEKNHHRTLDLLSWV